MSKWMLKQCSVDLSEICEQLRISSLTAHLLYVRGYKTKEQIKDFFDINTNRLHSYRLFYGIEEALQVISKAILQKQKITVFGDYDADGIMSTVILYKTLSNLGADVSFYIPDRENEGYGLNYDALQLLKENGTDIVFACDNGISAISQIEFANSIGLQVVVIDHHDVQLDESNENGFILPEAAALINPKIKYCQYPYKYYCAAGLCYRFAEALYKYQGEDWHTVENDFVVLAAIATVCDLVELRYDNRIIVKYGLDLFKSTKNLGLNALISACGLDDKQISTYHIGYIIGPCINASGRIMIASKAVELFLTEDVNHANILANELIEYNNTRKLITSEGTDSVLAYLDAHNYFPDDKILVLYDDKVQSSVAGIIAGKIKERCHKPVIMLAGDNEIIKGSCRSVEQYNIFEGLSSVKHLLENFGGHPMAAGLSIKKDNIDALRKEINDNCLLDKEDMQPVIHIDKALNIYNADILLAESLQTLEPFGKGNEAPCFADKNVIVRRIILLGKNKNILRLMCSKANSNKMQEIISFYLKDAFFDAITTKYGQETLNALLRGQGSVNIDIVYSIGINEYNGRKYAQLTMLDFRMGE